jgi:hypothetical protein
VTALEELWDRFWRVGTLSFVARSARAGGWNGTGSGTVEALRAGEGTMTFIEAGIWRPEGGRATRFSNVFRWSVVGDAIRLEHLRFGADRPVHLFDLAPEDGGEWHSVSVFWRPGISRDPDASGLHLRGCWRAERVHRG